jgi:hypothetical protein
MFAPFSKKHLAIALVSAAVLLLQIAVTRILSVLLWYHWAFFAISLVMLGMGVPGVWLALSTRRPKLRTTLLASGALVPLGVAAVIRFQHLFGTWAIVFCMAALLPGLLALGMSICALLLEAEGPAVSRMYGSDLLGACAGALAVVPLMSAIPTPELAACAGLLPLAAHELCAPKKRRWAGRAVAIAVALSALIGAPYQIRHTKQYQEAGSLEPLFVKWTPTARLAIFPAQSLGLPEGFRWGLGARASTTTAPKQLWLEQDGSAGTPITRYDGNDRALEHLLFDVTSVGYQFRKPGAVAIVGAGGGRDILTARIAGAKNIDAIELNAGIVGALRGPFAQFSGNVYDLPGVRAIVGEGRSVLTRSPGGYDVIQISMIDSWAATAAGAYSLSENSLYTMEAYRLYFQRLSPRGVVSTSRWLSIGFGFEVPRLLLLTKAALAAEGVIDPIKHIALVQAGAVATVLMSKAPFSPTEVAALHRVAGERGFLVALPSSPASPIGEAYQRMLEEGMEEVEAQGFVLSPPTDDKPFFFQMLSPFREPAPELMKELGFNAQAVGTLRTLMIAMAIVTLLLFFSPFVVTRWLPRGPGFWRGSGYFLSIGIGFMLLEIAWLQRCVLYLGHPSLAATAALGFMLLGAGAGSIISQRVDLATAERLGWALPALCGAINLVMSPAMDATLGWSLQARLCVTGVMLVPAGMAMGHAFPLGMLAFGEQHKAWFWALNGAASVLASVVSLALAMELGYLRVGYLGAALYLPAWLALRSRIGEHARARSRLAWATAAAIPIGLVCGWSLFQELGVLRLGYLGLALYLLALLASKCGLADVADPNARRLRDGLSIAAVVPVGLVAGWHVMQLVRAFVGRLRYPLDLEWMEGGQLLAAYRMLHGQSVYDACSDGFIPFAYPPVHAALVALAGFVFGLDYPIARAVSILAFGGACYLLCREVHAAAGGRGRGWVAALVAAACFAASYQTTGAWYDLVRVDSTFIGLLVAGAVLSLPRIEESRRRRMASSRIAMAALMLTLAVFAKQTAALFIPWILGFALWREWRSGLRLTLAFGAMSTAALFALNATSNGRFWTLVFEVMRRHPMFPEQLTGALERIRILAPYLLVLPLMAGWLALKRRLEMRTAFWLGMCAIAVAVSAVTAAKMGAFINNIMTAAIFSPPAAIMLGLAWIGRLPRRAPLRALETALACGLFGALLFILRYDGADFIPNKNHHNAAVALSRVIRDLPGGVVAPAHSFLPIRLGHTNRQLHEQGYVDVMGAGIESIDVTECIARLDGRWLIVNDLTEPHLLLLLSVMYEPRGDLPKEAKPLVGKYTIPSRLFERRAGDAWQVDRKNRRELFDFESGQLDGWRAQGKAFDPGVTTAVRDFQQPIAAHRGHYLLNSFHPHLLDQATGSVTSPEFVIDRARLAFRAGGGSSSKLRVELVVDGQVVRTAAGAGRNFEVLLPIIWDVSDLLGMPATIVVSDEETGGWGHMLVDAFELFDPPT